MNQVFSDFPAPRQEASLDCGNMRGGQIAGVTPAALNELLHDLRQPLSAIESLAYCLEITAPEERILAHARRIQGLIVEMNRILARAGVRDEQLALESC
ncbi:MAG: hypothetical protein JO211_01790 [Acidobacteriaceae bacterium]|nr:hypothetical protein [Acidobacteriaceae bacterium]